MEQLQNTWLMSVPDGKGNVVNTAGRWVDGKMVKDFTETVIDPLHGLVRNLTVNPDLPEYKWTDNPDGSKTWELIKK
jgi:hypothetical protein